MGLFRCRSGGLVGAHAVTSRSLSGKKRDGSVPMRFELSFIEVRRTPVLRSMTGSRMRLHHAPYRSRNGGFGELFGTRAAE